MNNAIPVGANIQSMAVFNGRLYAGELTAPYGKVYVSTSGDTWACPQCVPPFGFGMGGPVQALAAFNGRLFAGDTTGRIYSSVDGSTWALTNGNVAVGTKIWTLAAHNNKLYAGDNNGKVYVSSDNGNSWNGANGLTAGVSNVAIQALTSFNGKIYAGDAAGKVYVSTEGSAWLFTNSSALAYRFPYLTMCKSDN